MKDKLRKLFSDINNIVIYGLIAFALIWESFDRGMAVAITGFSAVALLISGWYVVAYFVFSMRSKNYAFGLSEFISFTYFIAYSVYWLYEHGLTRKAAFLLLPLSTGVVISIALIFTTSESYKKMDRWEKGILQKIVSFFRTKS